MGDCTEYRTESGKSVSNGVVVVRSLLWPGSFNFYFQGKYMNIYVGNGHKYEVDPTSRCTPQWCCRTQRNMIYNQSQHPLRNQSPSRRRSPRVKRAREPRRLSEKLLDSFRGLSTTLN